ncbi:selenocysteine-specific elongation factor [Kineosphaera limosa]|nr:selenocysteine-specific elongation factor [Kineosphaera limosa]
MLATAGHVDHGKSTLVHALTGMEPDRWEAERRRGLTIDLGYAWTTLPSGRTLAFVDVPGHRRFIGNMLAGIGPVPAVVFVVAADAGWSAQSQEHLRAIEALGIDRGILVVTRADLADPAPALAHAGERLAGGSLADVEAVAVSALTGAGLAQLRAALDRLVDGMPPPEPTQRVRLWADRSFTIAGAGTVVTGTLGAGAIAVGDELEVGGRMVRVRGLQALGEHRDQVEAPARVAVNLRGVGADELRRGDALLTPTSWRVTRVFDARFVGDPQAVPDLPQRVTLHLGTASPAVHIRPLDAESTGVVRILLPEPLPVMAGDRAILRDPGDASGESVVGVVVVDADPPALTRRGDGARRGHELAGRSADLLDLATEVAARGAMRESHAVDLGVDLASACAAANSLVRRDGWLVDPDQWRRWGAALRDLASARATTHPLDPFVPLEAARAQVDIPDLRLVAPAAADAGLEVSQGRLQLPGTRPDLGAAEAGLRGIEERLAQAPFAAPEAHELRAAGLGSRQLAAAVGMTRLLRLGDGIYLQPTAPARAMRLLAALPQPFTTSQARQALGTTRRVAIPLLEHLDARGWTRRLDAGHRQVVRN